MNKSWKRVARRTFFAALAFTHASASVAWAVDDMASAGWTGGYVGGVIGASFGDNRFDERSVPAFSAADNWEGVIAGVTLGYNYQLQHSFVVGIEGDFSFADVEAVSNTNGIFVCGAPGICISELDNFGTIRGRLGFAHGQFLFFGTAGYAFAKYAARFEGTVNAALADEYADGFVWGGGIEWAFFQKWTAKVEYLRADLGRVEFNTPSCNLRCYSDLEYETVRLGINYRF